MLDPNVRISIDEALGRVLDCVGALPEQRVELIDALGRVLSHDVVSDIPEVHDAAQAVGLVTFGLDDEEAIADYIATHIARSVR